MLFGHRIEEFSKQWKLQRNYMWELILPNIAGIDGTEVCKYCQAVRFGDYEMTDVSEKRYGPYLAKYAGLLSIPNVTATFLKPIPDIVSAYFYEWKNLIVNYSGYFNCKSRYGRTAYITLYDVDGQETSKFKLVGVFPRTFPGYDLSYDNEEITRFEIELNVDKLIRI